LAVLLSTALYRYGVVFVAVILQLFAIWLAVILMSEECEDVGWFECVSTPSSTWTWKGEGGG
jgi:hypothetical protein